MVIKQEYIVGVEKDHRGMAESGEDSSRKRRQKSYASDQVRSLQLWCELLQDLFRKEPCQL